MKVKTHKEETNKLYSKEKEKIWDIEWIDDYKFDECGYNTTDPQDGGFPITTWWEDMRPNEVCELVKETYKRGFKHGVRSQGMLFTKEPHGYECRKCSCIITRYYLTASGTIGAHCPQCSLESKQHTNRIFDIKKEKEK